MAKPDLDFDDLEGLEIRKAEAIGFGVFVDMDDDGLKELVAAFAQPHELTGWLDKVIHAWNVHEDEDEEAAGSEGAID